MEWLINKLKSAGSWFTSAADELDKLDDRLQEAINKRTRRAFLIGLGAGVVVTVLLFRSLG